MSVPVNMAVYFYTGTILSRGIGSFTSFGWAGTSIERGVAASNRDSECPVLKLEEYFAVACLLLSLIGLTMVVDGCRGR